MASGNKTVLRPLFLGVGAVLLYVAAALASFAAGLLPVRPLYDGLAPPIPYRWVNPPPESFFENEPPEAGFGTVRLTAGGSEAASVTTGDGQASVVLPRDAIAPRPGETSASVTIWPLDPQKVVPDPIRRRFNGNAYRVQVVYVPSQTPVTLRRPVTVILRYAIHASEIWRSGEPEWTLLETTPARVSLQVFAETARLGIFLPTTEPGYRPGSRAFLRQPWLVALAILDIVFLAVFAVLFIRGRSRRDR